MLWIIQSVFPNRPQDPYLLMNEGFATGLQAIYVQDAWASPQYNLFGPPHLPSKYQCMTGLLVQRSFHCFTIKSVPLYQQREYPQQQKSTPRFPGFLHITHQIQLPYSLIEAFDRASCSTDEMDIRCFFSEEEESKSELPKFSLQWPKHPYETFSGCNSIKSQRSFCKHYGYSQISKLFT